MCVEIAAFCVLVQWQGNNKLLNSGINKTKSATKLLKKAPMQIVPSITRFKCWYISSTIKIIEITLFLVKQIPENN